MKNVDKENTEMEKEKKTEQLKSNQDMLADQSK